MGKKDTSGGRFELTRRDFLKVAGAGAAAVATMEPLMPAPAAAITLEGTDTAIVQYVSTCPYCSAQCGQIVSVGNKSDKVYDIWGDANSPTNRGGLCAKGAGAFQLATNRRRLGVPEHTAAVDGKDMTGEAWKRIGNGSWSAMTLADAMTEIAPRLVSARGPVGVAGASTLLAAPVTYGSDTYLGFSGLGVVAKGDGTFFVGSGGVKVDATAFGAALAALPSNTAPLAAAVDDLVWSAVDPLNYSSWTLVGKSDLKTKVFAASKIPDSVDIVRDGAVYYAYVATIDGRTLRFQSSDMLAWGSMADLDAPDNTFGMVNPSVIKSGNALKVWHNRYATAPGDYDYSLWYSEYDGTAWTSAVAVTHGGSQLAMAGYPYVTTDGTNYTLKYTGAGLFTSTTPVATPAVFPAAGAVVFNGANNETNVVGNANYLLFTENDGSSLGYAYSTIRAWTASINNAAGVQFFGCSHMNNEQNYLYRKLVANFGTSRVEHQARI